MEDLQKKISYHFRNPDLLSQALTHRSFIRQKDGMGGDNERLELLGDSVIELVVSHLLLDHFPHLNEGGVSKARASLVREATLALLAREVGLGDHLRLGRGEEETGGRGKDSILAGGMEALVAAVYCDGGYEEAFQMIERLYLPLLKELRGGLKDDDFKTRLQEYTQREMNTIPHYIVTREEGPDHDKTFEVVIAIDERPYGKGRGGSKKEAEQRAAEEALKTLQED